MKLVALALLVAAAIAAAIIGIGHLGSGGAAPVAAGSPTPIPEVPTSDQYVLMIPGYGGGKDQLRALGRELKAQGIRSEIVDVDDGEGDLREYSQRVGKRASELADEGYAIDLIGFSAGGITARLAATEKPDDYYKVITLATPHEGTSWADVGAAFGECPTACQQLRPDSELLADLDPGADDDWLSVYSKTDEVIRPPESSRLRGSVVRPIQNACPQEVVNHGEVPQHPQTVALVTAFLENKDLPNACAVS